jgi:hypothetical protein
MLALLNLASGECAKRNSTGQAGIQCDMISRELPGFRVSLDMIPLARNDKFFELWHSLLVEIKVKESDSKQDFTER